MNTDTTMIDDTTKQALLERAAVLSYLANDFVQSPPARANGNPEYTHLAQAMKTSVDQFVAAACAGEAVALQATVDGLKARHASFSEKFGNKKGREDRSSRQSGADWTAQGKSARCSASR
ncbi:hypothetical protein [Actibacterium lipolyticum]|uniref:hypothetical protein n=1 Tax=Actibacterium lipolyticum TaxID=1524263 RepID=UPI0011307DCD|nr:hypothetical protein [Actibacterium lipolyticum]